MDGTVRRRLLWIGGGLTTLVIVAAAAVLFFFRDTATPVTEEEVAATLAGEGGSAPGDPGLYSYATTGFEEADALGGGRHDYPPETFLTLRTVGCGTAVRWQALKERWDEDLICDDGTLQGIDSYHEWFGVTDLHEYRCEEGAHVYPEDGETSWSFTCSTEVTFETYTYEVVGTEELVIAGEAVPTLHLRIVSEIIGETNGDSEAHEWVLPGTNLVVKKIVRRDNVTDTRIGGVGYHEEFEAVLTSLSPAGS
jgi:hypothetical protein